MIQLETPVLFLMFNRPDLSVQVFSKIREARPKELYVALDGPRESHPTDQEKINKCLDILKGVDWPCQVKTLLREKNLGCGKSVSSAISWFFDQVPMGIILEDDCVPDVSFFSFCEELLQRYEHHPEIMHIGGVNFQNGRQRGDGSYYFTKICHVWGWASWRRAWQLYDYTMKSYPDFKENANIEEVIEGKKNQESWIGNFDKVIEKKVNTWDYQWVYSIWSNNGLCILPNQNLITNIGFITDATHTKTDDVIYSNRLAKPLVNIKHPKTIKEDKEATNFSLEGFYKSKNIWYLRFLKIKKKLKLLK